MKNLSINSRQKGARGEREFAKELTHAGFPAERGQQHAGGQDSPDVKCPSLSKIHFEVKRVERGNPYNWLTQAQGDCGPKIPVVAHKRNHCEWLAILPMTDFLEIIRKSEIPNNGH